MRLQVSDDTISALAASPPLHQRFPNISSIFITSFWQTGHTDLDDALFSSFISLDARHMARLKSLDLRNARCLTFDSIVALCQCTSLETLSLPCSREELPDHALGPLTALPRLQRLCFVHLPCNDMLLADLGRLTGLKALRLRYNDDDEGVPATMTVPSTLLQLRYLHIENLERDRSARVIRFADIAWLPRLTHLCIRSLTSSCRQLAASTCLTTISCETLNLVPRDAADLAILDAIDSRVKPVASVTRLCVKAFMVDIMHLARGLRMFPNLLSLSCSLYSDHCFELLADLVPGIRDLTLNRNSRLPAVGLQCLAKLTALERLCVVSSNIPDLEAHGFVDGGSQSLRRIELHRCNGVSDAIGTTLAMLPALVDVVFVACKQVTQAAVQVLMDSAPALQRVAIDSCGLDAAGIAQCREHAASAGGRVRVVSAVPVTGDDSMDPFPYY